MNDKAYLIAEPRPEEEDASELEEEEAAEQQTAAAEQEEEEEEEDDENNNNNHYYNDDIDTADLASIGSSAVRLSLAHQSSSNPTTPSISNSNSNPPSSPSSPSSPLATAALAAAAASASVAAAAARITAKAAHRALATGAAGSHRAIQLIDGSDASSLAASQATSSGSSSSGSITDNNYTNVAVGLGAMLLNDTLLLDGNDTALSIFGDMVSGNGSGGNASAAVNVTASKVDEDDFTQLLRMAVTSVLLGLMILVTIIGKFDMECSLGVAQTAGHLLHIPPVKGKAKAKA